MKKSLAVLTLGALVSVGVFAANDIHDEHKGHHHVSDGMMQCEHMAEMKEQMKAIRNTEDPEKRHELMQKHHEAMQAHMQSMKNMHGNDHANRPAGTGTRMERMERQMRMMQGSMEQMMERESVGHTHH